MVDLPGKPSAQAEDPTPPPLPNPSPGQKTQPVELIQNFNFSQQNGNGAESWGPQWMMRMQLFCLYALFACWTGMTLCGVLLEWNEKSSPTLPNVATDLDLVLLATLEFV